MNETGTERASTRSRENTRARLLDAAAQVFAEVGLGEASVEAVCERAGFTRGAFYSNFDSKDELFVELVGRFVSERVEAVRRRVAELLESGDILAASTDAEPANAVALVQALDVPGDDRFGVMLMNEIRIRAMRDPQTAAAFLAQDDRMLREVAQLVDDIAAAKDIRLAMPAEDAARMVLTAWEGASARALIAGATDEELFAVRSREIARVGQLLIDRA
ncbi:TetR/AcrR family transcriptional regulator [Microbacterium album]|uniref:TetR-family regulatory protein n=1 Tax=Microbacterium album TaxID=2053191 RepID=A0A917IBW2_9MICO|nr:TetR/AcrR family transcriptional regulator [Microbacterium album]GGH36320.1 putative TetR-family regulatory protein [Microbacterium album]